MRTILWLLAAACLTGPALAAEPTFLAFERLDGVRVADQVEVHYQMAASSWQTVVQAGQRPQLIAELLAPGRKSRMGQMILTQPSGKFRVTAPEGMTPVSVRFAIRHPSIGGFMKAGVGVVTLSYPLEPQGQRDALVLARTPSPRNAQNACDGFGPDANACRQAVAAEPKMGAGLVAACAEQGRHRLDCLQSASGRTTDMAAAVRACSALVAGVEERRRCVQSVAGTQRDPASIVRACGQGFEMPVGRLNCVARAAAARSGDGTGLVEQCVFAFEGPVARLDCITIGESAAVDPAAAVAACRQALPWEAPRRRCVEAAARARVDVSSAIIACRSGARSPAAVLQCVQTAARSSDAAMATTIHGCSGSGDDSDFNQCVARVINN